MQPKTIPTVCLDPNHSALTSLRSPAFATPDCAMPDAGGPGEALTEYSECWSVAALNSLASGRGNDHANAADPWSDELLRFVLEARNWHLVDLVFALREAGDERGARLLAEEILALCPRLNRGAIRRLRTISSAAATKTPRMGQCGREARS